MPLQEIIDDFTSILKDLLGNDDIVLESNTRRENVQDWDSFNYINFIVAIESKYGVKFPMSHVESFETVGEIAEDLQSQIAKLR